MAGVTFGSGLPPVGVLGGVGPRSGGAGPRGGVGPLEGGVGPLGGVGGVGMAHQYKILERYDAKTLQNKTLRRYDANS